MFPSGSTTPSVKEESAMLKKIVLSSLLLSMTACYTVSLKTNKPRSGQVYTQRANTFVYGLVGGEVRAECEPAVVTTSHSFVDTVISWVTLGLYEPVSVTVQCAKESSSDLVAK